MDYSGVGTEFKSAFSAIAKYQNRPSSYTVLYSSTVDEDLVNPTQDLVERLSRRIGLWSSLYSPRQLYKGDAPLPGLAVLEDGTFLSVLEETATGNYLVSGLSGMTETEEISRNELRQYKPSSYFSLSQLYLNQQDPTESQAELAIEKKHWFFGSLAPFWRSYVVVAIAALFINLIALASPLFVMNVYDRVLPNEAISTLWVLAVGVSLALLFDLLLKTSRAAVIDYTGRKLDIRLSQMIFDKVIGSKISARPFSTGEYANRATQYEFVREFFSSNTIATFVDTVFIFIFLIAIWFIAGPLVFIPMFAFILVILIGFIAQYRISKRIASAANEAAQRQSLLVESIITAETIKCLRAEGAMSKRWRDLTVNSTYTSEQIKQITSTAANQTQFVQQLVTVGLILLGTNLFTTGDVTMGAIIASVILSGRAVAPLSQLTMTIARFRQVLLSLSILNKVMEQEDDEPVSIGFVNRKILSGEIAFENVSFQYDEDSDKALSSVNFKIKAGEKVGIIGRIGSGKTTIGRLLAALYEPQEGRVLIDKIDCQQYHPAEVRSAVALAGQSSDLFSGTVKENLLLANSSSEDEDLINVSEVSGINEFISSHPKGFDMQVGENGNSLSSGQKQSVTIARLLLSNPKIVFLDEPSGAMDQVSEKNLISNLGNVIKPETTLIMATHRFSMLSLVDRIIVLDKGKVIADGPKNDVIAALKRQGQSTGR